MIYVDLGAQFHFLFSFFMLMRQHTQTTVFPATQNMMWVLLELVSVTAYVNQA